MTLKRWFSTAAVLVAVALSSSCTVKTVPPCSQSCGGCCDSFGSCQSGTGPTACGTSGQTCVACAANENCKGGICVAATSGCGPGTCTGCCSGGTCVPAGSQNNSACGANGAACGLCNAGTTCSAGLCVTASQPGNITFRWTFAGQTCAMDPRVASVRITMPGETLMNNGIFACTTAGVDGITLQNFAAGTYTYTVDGLDSTGQVIYTTPTAGSVTVNGNVQVTVDLQRTGVNSYAFLKWTFPPNGNSMGNPATCAQAGMNGIGVTIDGTTQPTQVACTDGESATGWQTPPLTAGTHNLTLVAYDANSVAWYQASGTFTTTYTASTAATVTFAYSVGGVNVGWTLFTMGVQTTCAAAGLTDTGANALTLQLYNGATPVFPGSGVVVGCSAGSARVYPIAPGTYTAIVSGTSSGNVVYTSPVPAPSVTVTAGTFPDNTCTAGTTGCIGTLQVNGQ